MPRPAFAAGLLLAWPRTGDWVSAAIERLVRTGTLGSCGHQEVLAPVGGGTGTPAPQQDRLTDAPETRVSPAEKEDRPTQATEELVIRGAERQGCGKGIHQNCPEVDLEGGQAVGGSGVGVPLVGQ